MATLNRILAARRFAVACHGEQTYGPDLPYEYHLEKVRDVARRLITEGMLNWANVEIEDFIIALWLHDTVEDTPATLAMITALWGHSVARMVDGCTDVEGKNRHERKWGTPTNPGPMLKLRNTRGGVLVKLCDRIANIEACLAGDAKISHRKKGKSKLDMYRKEQAEFRELREDGPHGPVWDHLESLFREER